ncbi:DMT family transporter [Bradyrhizobium sp.]|uniref:DMT family transporter n=1 Tax=Bradyrhizobium sp. TaxID=376 RepID=UPI003C4C2655
MKPRSTLSGTLALTATAALWGSNHAVARAARDAVPLPALVFWRWFPAAIVLTLIAWPALRLAWPAIRPRLSDVILGGAVGVGVFSYLLIGGAYQSLAIEVGFINATTPVWVVVLSSLGGEAQLSWRIKAGLAVALAGTLLIISKGEPQILIGLHLSLGNLWSLLAAMSFAWFSIQVRDWSRTIAPLPLTVVTAWAGLVVVMLPVYLLSILIGSPWLVYRLSDLRFAIVAIGYVGLAPTMLGNLFYLYGVAALGPARAAAFLYLTPLFSAAFSILWLGEMLAWYHAAGLAAIVAGLLLLGKSQRDRPKDQSISASECP